MFFLRRNHGILGINARNLNFLRPFNPSKAVAFADNKLKTKLFLEARGVPVPRLYAKIASRKELRTFDFNQLPEQCVLKPNFGYGGEGILVFTKRESGGYRTITGKFVSYEEIAEHCEDILDGMYSLNHRRDIAFFEQIIIPHSCFTSLNPSGLPDIRIIVHNLVPVMAMMRLATAESGGKANVHQGGIGLGIDIAKGITTFAVQRNKRIETLPNGRDPGGFIVPYWQEMLLIASRIQQITNIGFLGVDLTLDDDTGPILLEVNARAGLMVQIANMAPLGKRLERVAGLKVSSPEKGVRIAQDLFGERVIAKGDSILQKTVLATREDIEIIGGSKALTVHAVLRPDYDRTVFDPSLVKELLELDAIEQTQDGNYRSKFLLGGKKIQTVVGAMALKEGDARASIGKRDMKDFLVDPGRQPVTAQPVRTSVNIEKMDHLLAEIDRKVQLLRYIRPVNLDEEREKALHDQRYNPVFLYHDPDFDPEDLLDRLQYLEGDASPMGALLTRKRDEIVRKIQLLRRRGQNDAFTEASILLFGQPSPTLVRRAREELRSWDRTVPVLSEDLLDAEDVAARFETVLKLYGLQQWQTVLKDAAVTDCTIGRDTIILRRGAKFSGERVDGLIVHEIETHVLTAENGRKQPYEIFARGCAEYLTTQEGLAVYNEQRVLPAQHEKRFWPALGMLAVQYGLTHSFAELRTYIHRLGFDDARALRTCFTVKRGMAHTEEHGAFTKGVVYLIGRVQVEEYVQKGGSLRDLYIGKINIRDMDVIKKIPGIIDPVFVPRWLSDVMVRPLEP